MPSMPNRRNTETDEVSVIARDRACVRTEQYRHSEVMRSFGHSHIQRCVQAMAVVGDGQQNRNGKRSAVGRHKGSCTPTPRGQTLREARAGAGTGVAYRVANGPSLLTKQA
ncbi:unnamed protein product [Danaus chrysippus]|uniref:(African queen) hypothetical protein n=1 Tax=Danaus chrysippus TaxID=151541 RepID=A0A8J2QEH2_9NEOP|nr:unnamed protein product [Danaus chrysippus]